MSTSGRVDCLNTEFMYYSATLKTLAPSLKIESDRQLVGPWIRKLFRPEYHSSMFREKRNKYLMYLTLTLLNDEVYGVFREQPPPGALAEFTSIKEPNLPPPEWETDPVWSETIAALPNNFQPMACSVHRAQDECDADHQIDKILDQEFQFLVYLARPYVALIPHANDKMRAATWLQTLCTIHGGHCSSMRGVRNDYIMALLGYVHNLKVSGPFQEYPPWRSLPPLADAAKLSCKNRQPITDPTCQEANEFIAQQPIPEEGAFCYIAVTGELLKAHAGPS